MNKKFFVINEEQNPLSVDEINAIAESRKEVFRKDADIKLTTSEYRLKTENIDFKHTENRIVVKVDLDYKDQHTFEDGTKIYIGRRFNNLNRRETEPVNAIVISGEGIPKGAEILVHHNSLVDTNKICGYQNSVKLEQDNSVRYYSIDVVSAYLWREGKDEWKPLKGFCTAYRVFKPYEGTIEGILPTQLKNVLYIRTGEYAEKVAHTLIACDHEIIFMGEDGREKRIIKCRHYEGEYNDREELTCIDHYLTENVSRGNILIGLSPQDCKTLKEYKNA